MKLACVLTTHLPMKAELQRKPDLRGKPVVITVAYGDSQVVLDHSPQASGVVAGMPLQEALSRAKGAILMQADLPHYHAIFDGVIEALCNKSPLVERAEVGCAYVGLDGLDAMHGGEARLVTSLLQAVPADLNPRIGIAGGKFPAYVAALSVDAGRARTVAGGEAEFLAQYPVDVLPISWQDKQRLNTFGIRTLGGLAAMQMGPVQAQFGKAGVVCWKLARGIDDRPFVPYRTPESVSEQIGLGSPATSVEELQPALEVLLARTFRSLKAILQHNFLGPVETSSGCSAVGSAPRSDCGGPGFKSRHPDVLPSAASYSLSVNLDH